MAEQRVITIGLAQILVGEASAAGVMPTQLTKLGLTYKDTCRFVQESGEVTEHFEEGNPTPIIRYVEQKTPKLVFSIMDSNPEVLADFVGGKIANIGSSGNQVKTWQFNGNEQVKPKAIKVESKQGLFIEMPNASIDAHINAEFSAKGIFLIEFEVTPLSVTEGGAVRAYVPKK